MLRPLPLLLMLSTLAVFPQGAAGAVCIDRLDHGELACASTHQQSDGQLCFTESLNPPIPDTWQSSTTCSIAAVQCPPELCAREGRS